MDQEQVHKATVAGNLPHAIEELLIRRLWRPGRAHDLGGDEDFFAGEPGFSHRVADFALVGVELRRVDVTIAGPERLQAGWHTFVCRRAVDAESQTRNLHLGVWKRERVCEGELVRHTRWICMYVCRGTDDVLVCM